jgi:tRNA (uracil-5-)-methyltransferase TRM9
MSGMQPTYRFIAQETWDTIAESFDKTRQKPWHYCLDFINSIPPSAMVADLGCGNGRHLLPCAEKCSSVVGVDISRKLLRIVQKKLHENVLNSASLVHSDVTALPFKQNYFDRVLFIASLHNIQGQNHRQAALTEVLRILKPEGIALVSVWSRWQDRYYKHFLKQFIVRKREFGDTDIYWRQQNLNVPRFYHLYGKHEFRQELLHAGFQIERIDSLKLHSKRFPDNYFAVVRKK